MVSATNNPNIADLFEGAKYIIPIRYITVADRRIDLYASEMLITREFIAHCRAATANECPKHFRPVVFNTIGRVSISQCPIKGEFVFAVQRSSSFHNACSGVAAIFRKAAMT